MEVKPIGEPCGYNGPYTFFKGLKITNNYSNNCSNSLLAIYNKSKPMTRKCAIDRKNENNNIYNQGFCNPIVLALGDFIPVKPWSDSHISCLAEIRMIWKDKNEQALLTGLRLYFLPENTPMGRNSHGEDEVVAISDKVVIRAEDLLNWFDENLEWNWGLVRNCSKDNEEIKKENSDDNECQNDENQATEKIPFSLKNSEINFSEVQKEKLNSNTIQGKVAVLSYPRYCRYRATLKRLEGVKDEWFKNTVVEALCGFSGVSSNLRVMFCRDTFDYPELETHELLCNHLAPKLKGRQRGRKKLSRSESPFSGSKKSYDSESDSNESDISIFSIGNTKAPVKPLQPRPHLRYNHRPARTKGKSESECPNENKFTTKLPQGVERNLTESFLKANSYTLNQQTDLLNSFRTEEKFFLRKLHEFHIRNENVIPQLLWLSVKDIHLYAIFLQVQKLGGYESVSTKKLWKNLFGENSLPELTITRRKYEKILLPLEKSDVFMKKSFGNSNKNIFEIKDEKIDLLDEADLSFEEMSKIQNKLKSKNSENLSVPVTVIYENSKNNELENSTKDGKSIMKSNEKKSMQKIEIQQPHTTITVHQTTIHPQGTLKSNQNQIQITNQIQIQQITVQPGRKNVASDTDKSNFRCNIKQDQDGQQVKIESHNYNPQYLRHFKNEKYPFIKEHLPFITAGTTITPVLSSSSSKSTKNYKTNPLEVIELIDSDGETSTKTSTASTNRRTSKTSSDVIPAVKKRKLDILREGGLEVTAISNKHGVISSTAPILPELRIPKPSKTANIYSNKGTPFNLPSAISLSVPKISLERTQNESMYTKTSRIFGNPKDVFSNSISHFARQDEGCNQVLDLTVKSPMKFPQNDMQYIPTTARQSRSPPPLNLSLTQRSPQIPKLSENGLQITLVPAPSQALTYTQHVHNSQNHNMKRKTASPNGRMEENNSSEKKRKSISPSSSSSLSTTTTTAAAAANFNWNTKAQPKVNFPPFLANMQGVTNDPQPNPYLPILSNLYGQSILSNLYGQTPNWLFSNQVPQELLQLYKNLPADLGMIPVTKS